MAIHLRVVPDHVHAGENDAGDATGATIPTSHATSHAAAGTDPITPASIGAADTDHSADHETGGADALAHLAAAVIDSGTLDGDRLPAMSAGKKGAVPATGTPANHYLRDDGFAHPAQAEINGLETTATPQFAGLGIGTAGAANEMRLVEGARIGIAGGPTATFRDSVERLELLDGDLVVGDSLPVPGSGMSWSATDITDMTSVRVFAELDGVLFAGAGKYDGSLVAGRVLRLTDGTWSSVLSTPSQLGVLDLCAHNGALFAAMSGYNRVYRSLDGGATWDYSSPVANPVLGYQSVSLLSYGGKLYCGHHGGKNDQRSIVSSSTDGVTWEEEFSISHYTASGDFYSLVHHAGYLYAVAVVSGAAKIYRAIPGSGTWTLVHSASGCSYWTSGWLVSFGGYLYCSLDASIIRSADAGATWTTAANVSIGGRWAVHNGQLYTSRGKTISVSSDGVSWTTSRTSSQTSVYGMLSFGGSLYAGTGNSGYVEIGADATYVPARGVKSFGDVEFFGRLEPSGNCGALGQLLMSRGGSCPNWLPVGPVKTYLAGSSTIPVYQAIPASDVVNTPAGSIAAVNVQTALNELDTEKIAKATFTEQGDILYASAAATPAALPHGTAGDPLLTGGDGANPAWGKLALSAMANMATSSLIYRKSAGDGAPEVNTLATLKADLGTMPTSDGITALTGDVTASGPGSVAATIAAGAVTYAKIQNVSATNRMLGRISAGAGSIEELTAANVKTFLALDAAAINLSATDKLIGRSSAGSGAGEEITCTAAGRALLDDATAADQAHTLGLGTADSPQFQGLTVLGNILIGTTTDIASAILNVASTSKGALLPRMTTTQRDAISTPVEGMLVFNLTTHVLNYYTGSAWAAV